MAFRLAEAYVELKARGEKELHKSLDKTKEKVKEVGPATEQTEKQVEKAAQKAAKEVAKAGDNMAEAMQKPIDKLAEFEKEMKAKFASLRQQSEKLKENIRSDSQKMIGPSFGPTNSIFGRFGGVANVAAGAGLVGIAKAVVDRGVEIDQGATSEVLGPGLTREIRDIIGGMKEVGSAFVDVAGGFVDGLLGLVGILANVVTFGGLEALGAANRRERLRIQQERAERARAYEMGREIQAVDPFRPIREAEKRGRIDDIFNRGGIAGLEAEARRLSVNAGGDLDAAQQLLQVNQRIVQEKEKALRLDEAAAKAQERAIHNAQRQGASAWLEYYSDESPEIIAARQDGNMTPDQIRRLQQAVRERDAFRGHLQSGRDADSFATITNERVMSMIEEGDIVKKLRREYEELAERVANMPAGRKRDIAEQNLAEARINLDAAAALQAEKNQEREQEKRSREQARIRDRQQRFGEGIVGGILRGVLGEFDFQQSNRPRNTASFQTVPVEQFARLIEADIAAKEEEKQRVEEAKRMHDEAQAERERIANAAEETARAVANGIAAVFG